MNEPAIDSGGGLVRLRLDIAYDGTEFAGWAAQAGQRTVAGVLDEALSTVFRIPVKLRAAGRTDAGVHATGQVAHVDVPADALCARLSAHDGAALDPMSPPKRLQSSFRWCGDSSRFLPARCARASTSVRAAAGFDARFSALRRHYEYRLSTAPYGVEPQQARYRDGVAAPTGRGRDGAASRDLLGLHDFAAFCRHREGATTIRDLQRLDWSRDGDRVTAYVTADAFCWSMVRSLVGALLAVGEHRREPGWCATLLESTRRSSDFAAAPPQGSHWSASTTRPTTNSRPAPKSPATCGSPTRSGLRRSRPPDWPCPRRCRPGPGGRASCPPRCSDRRGCRSGRRRGTTRWFSRCRAG